MALVPAATASLMQVVCFWTSPPLSQFETSKPYWAAFFWYIFQEKAWDGLSIWAMNVSLGLAPAAPDDAALGAAPLAAGLEPLPLQALSTRTAATERVAIVIRLFI